MLEEVKEIICEYIEVDEADVTLEASLRYDIGATSFDLMNVAVAIEEKFSLRVPDSSLSKIKTVGDIVSLLENAVV